MSGLTPEGFTRQRLPEIKADLDQRLTTALGPINVKPDSVIGQIIGALAEAYDTAMQMLEANYLAMYPQSAEGAALDGAVSFVGLERLPATATVVTAAAYGKEGTLIPAGSIARASAEYRSTSDVVISRSNALDVEFQVDTLSDSEPYQILLGGASYTFQPSVGATRDSILNGLAALVDTTRFFTSVSNGRLRVYAADSVTPFAVTLDTKLSITKRGSPVVFVAADTGANAAPVGALSIIGTPINGWDAVYNLGAGDIGRDRESDTELRLRHAQSVRATGSATVEAIRARMLAEVDGVTSIQIYENRGDTPTDDGIPPHAFQCVVIGGTNSEIGAQLWKTKPAAIETFGNVSVTVTDSNGDPQTVHFSRAVPKYIWFSVTVDSLNTEETLPVGADAAIKQAIVDYGNAFVGVGDDIVLQKFYGPIYAGVPGIGHLTIQCAVTDALDETPVYSSENILIGKPEGPVFSVDTITVTGV
ncbi:MAG: baseplate J/gp47 family protein [Burkholderiaceae bacterium]